MKIIAILGVLMICSTQYAKADGIILDGSKEISNQNFKSNVEVLNPQSPIKNVHITGNLKVKGSSVLDNVSVDGDIECLGSVRITNVKASLIKIKGNAVLENVKVENFNLLGSLEATNMQVDTRAKIFGSTTFVNSKIENLTVSTELLTLHNTRVDDLVMTSAPSMREVVDVKGSSKVSEVTFYSNAGTVNIYGKDASVGKVHGGTVVQN